MDIKGYSGDFEVNRRWMIIDILIDYTYINKCSWVVENSRDIVPENKANERSEDLK
jgi:hypothetical protein